MIAAPRDPHEEEQARLQENLFYTNLSSLQPKTNARFWLMVTIPKAVSSAGEAAFYVSRNQLSSLR